VAGLVERILITLVLGTIGAIGWRATRGPQATRPARPGRRMSEAKASGAGLS
jgi:hypothetical protein